MEPRNPDDWLLNLLTQVAELVDGWSSDEEDEEGGAEEVEEEVPVAVVVPGPGVHWAEPVQVVIHDGEEWEFDDITTDEGSDDDNEDYYNNINNPNN